MPSQFKALITAYGVFFISLLFSGCSDSQHIHKGPPLASHADMHSSLDELHSQFMDPPNEYRPETWFHLNGKNISEQGLTADLEAIKYAGMQGIQLFNKKGPAYPNVRQVSILSPEWEHMIGHVADEVDRLGLNLTMQNCPGWSMAGGPWVPAEEAQREIIHHTFYFAGGRQLVSDLPVHAEYLTTDRNYQDITVLAFPTPANEAAVALTPIDYQTNNSMVPWASIVDVSKRVKYDDKLKHTQEPYKTYQQHNISPVNHQPTWLAVTFAQPETLRTIEFPPIRTVITNRLIPKTEIQIVIEALSEEGEYFDVATLDIPTSHWYDRDYPLTLSLPQTRSKTFRFTFLKDSLFLSYLNLNGQVRLHNHQAKASKSSRSLQSEFPQRVATNDMIDSANIIDVSDYVDDQGQLNWRAPAGDWTVVRLGHVNMLKTNRPAEPEATGWETSKVDKIAIENHLRNGMMGNLMRAGGPLDGHDLHGMLIDSWESHVPTWTMEKDGLLNAFRQRRGYDMTPFLPATMGYVVNSVETSNKFLRDLRQTMDDLYVENFFEHFRTVSHDMGVKVYTEGASGEVLPGDPLRYYGVSDFPMTEFWHPNAPSNKKEAKPIFAAASATHLYDKPFLAAEAATQLNVQWNETPADIQRLINENFAKGVNHLVFHTFSHTPQTSVVPGSSFGGNIGFPLLRTQTWWRHTPTWINGLSRAQLMLRQGKFVADVLWYLGDDLDRHPFDTHPFPEGYKFDFMNEEILLNKVSASEGHIYVEGAGDYRVIMLRDSQRMLLSTAKKLQALVEQGAVILGNKPIDSPSLMDDPQDLLELHRISNRLWGTTPKGVQAIGKGRVYWGQSLQSVFQQEKIQADVSHAKDIELAWLHRRTETADIYFVANPTQQAVDLSVSFRQALGSPEIWQPSNGLRGPAKVWHRADKHAHVAISLGPHASQFVVFNRDLPSQQQGKIGEGNKQHQRASQLTLHGTTLLSSEPNWLRVRTDAMPAVSFTSTGWHATHSGAHNLKQATQSDAIDSSVVQLDVSRKPLDQPWQLTFDTGWDAPQNLSLTSLVSLTKTENPAVQHYSGSVVYTSQFNYGQLQAGSHQRLDLGEVYDIAELWINNKRVDTRLASPYVFDVTGWLTSGLNEIKVVVTNTWRNQLIYDNQRPAAKKKTWTTNPPKQERTALELSGLVGPVMLTTTTPI